MPTITPNLWFDCNGREAAEFYVSVFPNSKITRMSYYAEGAPGPAGSVMRSSPPPTGPDVGCVSEWMPG